jgi:hypothetical protein
MAEHKIQGGDYLLKINDDTVVCLTSVSLSDSVTVVDASSACGPDKSPGSLEISINFEGQHLQDPDNGKISGTSLSQLLRSESTISFELGPLLPAIGDEIQSGDGFISELSSTYAFDSVGTFTGTIQIYGLPTTTVYDGNVSIGQFINDGYVCYIDAGNYYMIAKDMETAVIWGNDTITTGATGTAVLDGLPNTAEIVAADTGTTAAAVCQSAGAGWFLPSLDELEFGALGSYASMPFFGSDYNASIWTSTEVGTGAAMSFDFTIVGGSVTVMDSFPTGKTASNRVIAYKKINL